MLSRPTHDDYPEFQEVYISKCPDDIIPFLVSQGKTFSQFINNLDEKLLDHRYETGKWSLREVIIHIIDTEMIFDYRCLAIVRGDTQALNGFDQDVYIQGKDFSQYSSQLLAKLFDHIRGYSLILFESFRDEDWLIEGKISDYTMRLNAMPYMLGGHLEHHMRVIKERYL